ncbi:helicase-associated domain-containing protein [Paenibacillus alginolyticus]|uniref:Helicase-associated domain-containing protein n=2 Tax=Paenibacillus alginolyticus TaxID=59839 RepID=A0ABT4GJR9_9BACL|nr:helicase-associated domain-containing protein [Paenibacillus alginolyticus]MCY9696294.1 helicase-associated domain-containing protein [Paenibacillus alginolyticus]
MRFEHIDRKMPRELKELIMEQKWCSSFLEQGVAFLDLMTDQKYLAELNRHLLLDEKHTLRLIVSAFGCEPFTREALEKQAALRMSGAQVALGLVGLRRAGAIAAFRKAWGEQLFILPEDAFAAWQLLLFPSDQLQSGKEDMDLELWEAGSAGQLNISDPAKSIHPRGLAQQLFHFLVACNQQLVLPLTNKGTLHKKQLQKLTEHLALPNDILRSSGLTYAFRDVYDEPTALMIEIAIRMGFLSINSQGDGYLFNQQSCLKWLQDSYARQQGQLYQIWRQLLVPAPVWLEHGISWMERGEYGQWYEVDIIVKGIRSCCSLGGQVTDEASLRKAIMTTWMVPLSVFRFIELGIDKEDHLWFRWLITPIQQASHNNKENDLRSSETHVEVRPSLYVQPDFEMLLPPDVSLHTEWNIAAFADLQTTDLVRTYRITKESCCRAWEKGMSSEEMVRMLHENALYEVPAHITITLEQWGEQAGKLYIEEVTLLRCRSEDIAEALLRNEKCLPLLGERVGGSDFIVLREHLTLLTKCLEKMGFNPRSSRKDKHAEVSNTLISSENQTGGLCYSRDTIQLYEMDTHLPVRDELYPDMQDIPVSWIKEFRAYHGSTRKEMIRKAIEWKSVLQLRKEGRNRLIIPRILREERSGWILEGLEEYQEISLASEDWEEMKLILPGINDEGVYM